MGWTKARELVKVARREGQNFDCAPWVHKARELPREEFKREVEKHLTGRETEPWEIIKSRGYCLEMICADFLAGANFEGLQIAK
jgi:hypothetical protein